MLLGSRVFVFTIYLLLGLSFMAETAVLAYEFSDSGWFTIATHDSHVFLFFPILGSLALAAFYVPSCVFVDMYWRHVKLGGLRFAIGFVVLAAAAYALSDSLNTSTNRSIFEIAPSALLKDRSEPAGCGNQGRPCERVALLDALSSVRQVSQTRLALKDFVRDCSPDPLLEASKDRGERKRFCFASTALTAEPRLTTDRECCDSQKLFMSRINALHSPPQQRSLTGTLHALFLPLKIFFLLVLLAISVLLALRNASVTKLYAPLLPRIEFGVLIGTLAMIFFPLMSQGFVLTADALYGTRQIGGFKPMVPLMSFAFGAWGLLLLLFFYHRRDKQVEMIGKMAGVLASVVAVIKYDLLISFVSRAIGAGASEVTVGLMLLIAVALGLSLLLPLWRQFNHEIRQTDGEPPSAEASEAPLE